MSEATPDFQDLLSMDASEAVRPPAMPSGTYRALVSKDEPIKSSIKGTPGIQVTFTQFEPMAGVDPEKWQEYLASPVIDGNNISMSDKFWLSKKAMFMLKEFCQKCGAQDGPLGKMLADSRQNTVLIEVGQTVGGRDGQTVFNEIRSYAADN